MKSQRKNIDILKIISIIFNVIIAVVIIIGIILIIRNRYTLSEIDLLGLIFNDGEAQKVEVVNFDDIGKSEIIEENETPTNTLIPTIEAPMKDHVPTLTPTPIPTNTKTPYPTPTVINIMPILEHYSITAGTGIFESGTFSTGMYNITEDWLWENGHMNIQRIRQEEHPDGCDVVRYNAEKVWISSSKGMYITINGINVGEYTIDANPLGYIFEYKLSVGDKICAVNFPSSGFAIFIGPDIYFHYDSYCFRGNCN